MRRRFMYHIAPWEKREAIEKEGLTPGQLGGVYLWLHEADAWEYIRTAPWPEDVYEVDVTGLVIEKSGPYSLAENERWYPSGIPPERLRRLTQ